MIFLGAFTQQSTGGSESGCFYRINVSAPSNDGNYVYIDEIEFLSEDNVILSQGGTALASGSSSSSYLPDNAFNSEGEWRSAAGMPQWIGYEFTETVDIFTARLKPSQVASFPKNFTIEKSTDAETWEVCSTWQNVQGQTNNVNTGYVNYDLKVDGFNFLPINEDIAGIVGALPIYTNYNLVTLSTGSNSTDAFASSPADQPYSNPASNTRIFEISEVLFQSGAGSSVYIGFTNDPGNGSSDKFAAFYWDNNQETNILIFNGSTQQFYAFPYPDAQSGDTFAIGLTNDGTVVFLHNEDLIDVGTGANELFNNDAFISVEGYHSSSLIFRASVQGDLRKMKRNYPGYDDWFGQTFPLS